MVFLNDFLKLKSQFLEFLKEQALNVNSPSRKHYFPIVREMLFKLSEGIANSSKMYVRLTDYFHNYRGFMLDYGRPVTGCVSQGSKFPCNKGNLLIITRSNGECKTKDYEYYLCTTLESFNLLNCIYTKK